MTPMPHPCRGGQSVWRNGGLTQSHFTTALLLLILVASMAGGWGTLRVTAKGVHVTVQASWTETSLLQEGCEWAGKTFGSAGFFHCVELTGAHAFSNSSLPPAQLGARKMVPHAQFDLLTSAMVGKWMANGTALLAAAGLPPLSLGQHALFRLEMAARLYSPAVEAHYAIAERAATVPGRGSQQDETGCRTEAFVTIADAAGRTFSVADVDDLKSALAGIDADAGNHYSSKDSARSGEGALACIPQLDHVHPLSSSACRRGAHHTIVLYGLIAEKRTARLYDAVVDFLRQRGAATPSTETDPRRTQGIAFLFRHLPVDVARLRRRCGDVVSPSDRDTDFLSGDALHWATRPLYVSGYGVTVDLKNMEYKVVDEKKGKNAAAEDDDADSHSAAGGLLAETGAVGGFSLKTLKTRYPSLAVQLDTFASAMENEVGDEETKVDLDVVEIQNIGVAAAQYVSESSPDERVNALLDIASRFPAHATRLGRLATQSSRLSKLQSLLSGEAYRKLPQTNVMFFDGVQVEPQDVSLFGVLGRLREAERFGNDLRRVLTARPPASLAAAIEGAGRRDHGSDGFVTPDDEEVLTTLLDKAIIAIDSRTHAQEKLAPRTGATRVNIPMENVIWLNDIETSPVYRDVPRALSSVLSPTAREGSMPRRNIIHLVLVLTPSRSKDLSMLPFIESMLSKGLSARIGIIVLDEEWKESVHGDADPMATMAGARKEMSAASETAMAFTAALFYAVRQSDNAAIFRLFRSLLVTAMQAHSTELSEELIESALHVGALLPEDESLAQVVDTIEFQQFYHAQQETLRTLGLRSTAIPRPAVFVSGQKVAAPVTPDAIIMAVVREMELVHKLIERKVLTDDMEDLHAAVLAHEGSTDHCQPLLEESNMLGFQYNSRELLNFLQLYPFLYPLSEINATAPTALSRQSAGEDSIKAEKKRKAPLVSTATPLSAVLAMPDDLSVGAVAELLLSVLTSHRSVCMPDPSASASSAGARKRTKTKEVAPAGKCDGAVRATAVFLATTLRGELRDAELPRGCVADMVSRLLTFDADVMQETGRHSNALEQYVQWLSEAALTAGNGTAARLLARDTTAPARLLARHDYPAAVRELLGDDSRFRKFEAKHQRAASFSVLSRELARALHEQLPQVFAGSDGDEHVASKKHAAPHRQHTPSFEPLLLVNGKAVALRGPVRFTAGDTVQFFKGETAHTAVVQKIVSMVDFTSFSKSKGFAADDLDASFYASKTAAVSSLFTYRAAHRRLPPQVAAMGFPVPLLESDVLPPVKAAANLAFTVEPSAPAHARASRRSHHRLTIVVDPAARDAQLLVSLGEFFLRSSAGVSLTVYLKPTLEVTRPIRDFYTLVANSALTFDEKTGAVVPPAAVVRALPMEALLTLGVEEPGAWTVFPHAAAYDLDNIILAKLPRHEQFVHAAYRIQSILVTGSVIAVADDSKGSAAAPPSAGGLPLTLRSALFADARSMDTRVMNSLGYYQLQSAPGLWQLSVLPGPFAKSYYVTDLLHRASPVPAPAAAAPTHGRSSTTPRHIPVVLSTFTGLSLNLLVKAVPSEEPQPPILTIAERLVEDVKYTWPPKTKSKWSVRKSADPAEQRARPTRPTLNIFSVASGRLYERFLRMMMYSVYNASSDKHGENTTLIKFWIIENFLSPQFKAYIPLLAKHLGFEVGLVTYRWPWWLPKQTEKQRKIWAYKVLFLDVLFPLDVDRVIFVDADQTDRADLHELYNMDIDDRAIAMTPFCEKHKNEATTGFRFWMQGSWTKHLEGLPYHISAIFLIDLRRFRALAAGDTYRGYYSALVQDPNSLANLDQDLPNYLQHQVPIFSLPEEWLWCETWCSAASKKNAKTIDLCNNPLTKIPKLDNAKMIVPDWEEVDDRLENLTVALIQGS